MLRIPLSGTREVSIPAAEVPGVDEPRPLQVEFDQASAKQSALPKALTLADTRSAGLYKVTWKESQAGPRNDLFAVNPDARESELARMKPDELKALWSPLDVEVISVGADADAPLAVRGQEIWRTLATALLCLVVVEACFATWTGRQR
jgi:hypothetical protein